MNLVELSMNCVLTSLVMAMVYAMPTGAWHGIAYAGSKTALPSCCMTACIGRACDI